MATLQGSGAISLNDIRNVFGGANPVSINQFYRGGGRVPATRTVSGQDGPIFQYPSTPWSLWISGSNVVFGRADWQGTVIAAYPTIDWQTTAYASGGYTYYRGGFQFQTPTKSGIYNYYAIYRTYSSTININTNVPGSGTISFSQLYGATTP